MLHIAVVEDDKAYQDKIVSYLHRYEEEMGDRFKLSLFSDGDEIAENYKGDYDLILMDIEMRFLNGIQAAERIRVQDEKVILIFLTNTPQYALEGYRVSALDYVLKPINYFEFCERIKRAVQYIDKNKTKYLKVPTKDGFGRIDISTIYYIEVLDHYITVHAVEGNFRFKGRLRDVESELAQDGFFPCKKGFLVNLARIKRISGMDLYVGEDVIRVSRTKRRELLDAMNDLLNESGM